MCVPHDKPARKSLVRRVENVKDGARNEAQFDEAEEWLGGTELRPNRKRDGHQRAPRTRSAARAQRRADRGLRAALGSQARAGSSMLTGIIVWESRSNSRHNSAMVLWAVGWITDGAISAMGPSM